MNGRLNLVINGAKLDSGLEPISRGIDKEECAHKTTSFTVG